MRDGMRIDPILDRLRAVWNSNPDQRLAQIIFNAAANEWKRDPFYMEDDELIDAIERLYKS